MAQAARQRRAIRLAGNRPGAISWFIGGIILSVSVAFLFSLHSVANVLYLARISDELRTKMTPQTNARNLMLRPRYAEVLPSDQRNLQKLFELSDAIQRLDIQDAHSLLKRQSEQQREFEHVAGQMNALESQMQSTERLIEKRNALGSTESALEAQYRGLLKDTRVALGFPAISEEELQAAEYGEYYTNGVLEGLPRLPAVPDDIENIQALNLILTAVRGAGSNPGSTKELDRLRGLSKGLIAADDALSREEETLRKEELAQKELLQKQQQEVLRAVHQAILSEQKIEVDGLAFKTYMAIRPFLKSVGVDAPEFIPGTVQADED